MRNSLKLSDARERTPAPTGVGAWAAKLKAAAFDAVMEKDMTEIMADLVKRAKSGDLGAAKLVLNYLTGPAAVAQAPVQLSLPTEMTDLVNLLAERLRALSISADSPADETPPGVPPPPPKLSGTGLAEVRERCASLLRDGPMDAEDLAGSLDVPSDNLRRILDCPWFERIKGSTWKLSDRGEEAVADLDGGPR